MHLGLDIGLAFNKPFHPTDVPGGVALFSPTQGVVDSGVGTANSWTDQLASAFVASQATVEKKPTIATGINGRPSLTFAKAADQRLVGTLNILATGATRYVIAVAKSADAVGGTLFTFRTGTAGGNRVWVLSAIDVAGTFFYFTDGVSNSVVDAVGLPAAITGGSPFLIEYELTAGAQPVIRINGVARSLTNDLHATGDAGTDGFIIGAREIGAQQWNGDIGRLGIWDGIPSTTNQMLIRTYFAALYGIPL